MTSKKLDSASTTSSAVHPSCRHSPAASRLSNEQIKPSPPLHAFPAEHDSCIMSPTGTHRDFMTACARMHLFQMKANGSHVKLRIGGVARVRRKRAVWDFLIAPLGSSDGVSARCCNLLPAYYQACLRAATQRRRCCCGNPAPVVGATVGGCLHVAGGLLAALSRRSAWNFSYQLT